MGTVAALYIDPRGPYPRMTEGRQYVPIGQRGEPECFSWVAPRPIDCWDETRDARKYAGPHPIVAHPPCGPWGRLRHLYKGSEHDCAPRAVEQVRRWGGVLEHPAGSKLWERCALHFPLGECGACMIPRVRCACGEPLTDRFGGYTIEIDQCEWGHVARKRTWLYLVGVPREALEAPPFPGREPTHLVFGSRGASLERSRGAGRLKACSAQQRRRTPPLFAEYLVRLARAVVKP